MAAAIFAVLRALPDIIAALKQLASLAESGVHYVDVRIQLGKFDKAVTKAENGKDTSELENLFHPVSNSNSTHTS
jgi:hypothetical protein